MHKKIGILGGMSPESTSEYYLHITRRYTELYGDFNYPEILIYSVRFQPYIDLPKAGRWDKVAEGLGYAAQRLETAGADFILIATNTMHLVFDQVQAMVNVPMLSLLEVVSDAIRERSMQKVGLLGTRFTMGSDFYPKALIKKGIETIVPDEDDQTIIHDVIYNELVAGKILPQSKTHYLEVLNRLQAAGAEGIILGCTEIPLLVKESDTPLVLFDTTRLHAEAALAYSVQ